MDDGPANNLCSYLFSDGVWKSFSVKQSYDCKKLPSFPLFLKCGFVRTSFSFFLELYITLID